MKWINIKDGLPKREDIYLIYPWKQECVAYFNIDGDYAGKWTNLDEYGYGYEIIVTYWMPLPDPPKELINE